MMTIKIRTSKGDNVLTLADDNRHKIKEVEAFLQFLYKTGKSPATIEAYCYSLKHYYEFLEEKGITYNDVFVENENYGPLDHFSDFIKYLQYPEYFKGIIHFEGEEALLSNSSVNNILAAVFSFYDYLSKNKNLKGLDVYRDCFGGGHFKSFLHGMHIKAIKEHRNVLKLRTPKKQIMYLTTEEFEKIFNCAKNIRDKCFLAIGFYGGLRKSEILNLRISDIAFWDNRIDIVPREGNINGSRVKNYAEGSVYVPNEVMQLIVKYIGQGKKYNCDYLFINMRGKNKGKPMNADNIDYIFRELSRLSGIKVKPHMLRHSFAVHRISEQGVNYSLVALQHDMRHKSIESTMIYAEFFNDAQREIARQYFEQIGKDFSPNDLDFYEDIGGDLL